MLLPNHEYNAKSSRYYRLTCKSINSLTVRKLTQSKPGTSSPHGKSLERDNVERDHAPDYLTSYRRDIASTKLDDLLKSKIGANLIGLARIHRMMEQPPSTQMVAPVTKSEARDAKKTAVPAHSSGLPKRPAGVRLRTCLRMLRRAFAP